MPLCEIECSYSIVLGEKVVARSYVQSSSLAADSILLVSKTEIIAVEQMGLRADRRMTRLAYRHNFGPLSCDIDSERFGSHSISFVERLVDGQALEGQFDWVIENNALGLLECGIRVMFESGRKNWRLLNLDDGSTFELLVTDGKEQGMLETNLGLNADTRGDFVISSTTPFLKIERSSGYFPSWIPVVHAGHAEDEDPVSGQVTEEEVILKVPGVDSAATICRPRSGRFAYFAVIVGGSGVHDRNGNLPGKNIGYEAWAKQLAIHGIASIRFDRYPADERQEEAIETLGFDDAVSQVVAALDCARSHAAGQPLVLIGHSLGATLVAAATSERRDVEFCFLLSATSKSLREVIREQSASLASSLTGNTEHQEMIKSQTDRFLDTVDVDAAVKERRMALLSREALDRSIEDYIAPGRRYSVIHGEADTQVFVDDAISLNSLINRKGGQSSVLLLSGRDHIFVKRGARGTGEGNEADMTAEASEAVATSILKMLDRVAEPI
jgi:pimeloyl-ACP methyl ester carboxylesterase